MNRRLSRLKLVAVVLTTFSLLAGACGTSETVDEGDDPTAGQVDDGGDRSDSDRDDAGSRGAGDAELQQPGGGRGGAPAMVVEVGPQRISMSRDGGCWIADEGAAECWDEEDEWTQEGDFVQISTGPEFACGVTSDSRVRCWSKEHGEGSFEWWDAREEIPVPEGRPVKQVEVDGPHLCAVHSDGTLGCYGRRYYGYVLTVEGWEAPEPAPLPSMPFIQISTGGWRHGDSTGMSCGIRSDSGTLACWTYDGPQPAPEGRYSQVSVSQGLTSGELSVGGIPVPYGVGVLICGVLTDGRAECWSMDGEDQNGERTAVKYHTPEGQFVQVSAGHEFVCGLRTDGTVECWQLDRPERWHADNADEDFPPVVLSLSQDSRFTRIAVGGHGRACGTRTDGRLECWTIAETEPPRSRVVIAEDGGSRAAIAEETADLVRVEGSGSSGFRIGIDAGTWVPVFSSDGEYELVVPGYRADALGTRACQPPFYPGVWGWIDGDEQRLLTMQGEHADAVRGPAFVFGDDRRAMCRPGDYRVYVSTTDASTWWSFELRREAAEGWGHGNAAALNRLDAQFLHIDAATRWRPDWSWSADYYNATARVAGPAYVCGILVEGGTECWGSGYESGPDPPPTRFIETAVASAYACGLKPDGSMQCWDSGDDYSAGLSPETTGIVQIESAVLAVCMVVRSGDVVCDYESDPGPDAGMEVAGFDHPVESISMSESGLTECALFADSQVTCRDVLSLAQIPRHSFRQVSTSDRHMCGILTDGTVECWGFFNRDNILSFDRNEHLLDAPEGEFTQLAAGDYHTCGLSVDGAAACWGWNRFGQSEPPPGRFTQIVSTMHMSCGLRPDGSVECWGYAGEQ